MQEPYMADCVLHKTSARHRGVNNGVFPFAMYPFYECMPVLAIGESGLHPNNSACCCMPYMLFQVTADVGTTSPYPTIENSIQSLMVTDLSRWRPRVLPGSKSIGVAKARSKALWKFKNGWDVGHFIGSYKKRCWS